MKENHEYFGKLNIQKKGELQEYLHKKKWRFAEKLGELGIKKHPIKAEFLDDDIFQPSRITQPRITSRYHNEPAEN
ncbi:MAG: hypothetical protein CBC46_09500 [Verrucomicrobiaceae bacterium TMED86]|nr:MAG: hypothetical protein CBC46_09500 [Verrucomicrobiaceae bacterium TMED86]